MKKTILLIEDNPDEILLAQRAFEKTELTAQLLIAESAAQARALLNGQDNIGAIHLVLLDLQLHDTNGLNLLAELRLHERTRAVPVVLLSSSDEPGDIATAYARGANSYLRKPVSFDDFTRLLRDVHRYWLVHNQLPPKGEDA